MTFADINIIIENIQKNKFEYFIIIWSSLERVALDSIGLFVILK